jgi:hypothetical protein
MLFAVWVFAASGSAYVITSFSPSAYHPDEATMNTALGIVGYSIETFEDGSFLDGLSYTQVSPLSFAIESVSNNLVWGGDHALRTTFGGASFFEYAPGVESFGVGISEANNQPVGRTLQINDGPTISWSDLPGFVVGGSRNIYIRIDAEPGDDPITKVHINLGPPGETIYIDHVALGRKPVSLGAPVTGSGFLAFEGDEFPFDNLTDGRFGDTGVFQDWSFWLGRNFTAEYFIVDLGAVFNIDEMQIQNTHNRQFNDRGTRDFGISLSTDGAAYASVLAGTLADVSGTGVGIPIETFAPSATGRYVRFDAQSAYGPYGSVGLNELSVFGDNPPHPVSFTATGTISTVQDPLAVTAISVGDPFEVVFTYDLSTFDGVPGDPGWGNYGYIPPYAPNGVEFSSGGFSARDAQDPGSNFIVNVVTYSVQMGPGGYGVANLAPPCDITQGPFVELWSPMPVLVSDALPLSYDAGDWDAAEVRVGDEFGLDCPYLVGSIESIQLIECNDGFDNDGDGRIDLAGADPGCETALDLTEKDETGTYPCDDGIDNEATPDGLIDYIDLDGDGGISDPPGDPACKLPTWGRGEDSECQDGINNDGKFGTDWDGGVSAGQPADPDGHDPQCLNQPWKNREETGGRRCGIGSELVLLVLPVLWLRRRRNG